MPAIWLRITVWLRGQWRAAFVAAVVSGVVAGLAIGVVSGTRRTSTAPDRYTAASGGNPDIGIQQQFGAPLDRSVAAMPGVASVESLIFVPVFPVSPNDGSVIEDPNPFVGDQLAVGGRLIEGRTAERPEEFTANRPAADLLAERYGIEVGDTVQAKAFSAEQVLSGGLDPTSAEAAASLQATFVGITRSPSEFDDASPQLVFPRTFLDAHPEVGVVQTLIAARLTTMTPDELLERVRVLPNGADAYPIPVQIVSESARRAVRFQATSLWIVSLLVVLAAIAVISVVVARTLRFSQDERQTMTAIGARQADLARERALEALVIALAALPFAVVVGTVATRWFPLATLRSFEPDPGIRFDPGAVVVGIVAVVAMITTVGFVVGRRSDGHRGIARPAGSVTAVYGAGWPVGVGLRFASGGARRRFTIAGLALGVMALLGSLVVGSSVNRIIDRPERWGSDFGYLFGNPYAPAYTDLATPLADDPDVEAVTTMNIGSLAIAGRDVAAIGFRPVKGRLLVTVIRGRAPATADELGIGGEIARKLGLHVGDRVQVAGTEGATKTVGVVGIVVTPDSAGNGAAMTFDGFQSLNPSATENLALVDLRKGAPAETVDRLSEALYTPSGALPTPISIRALGRVTAAPFVLGIVLALLLLVGGAAMITLAIRAHHRDLAVLHALGAPRRQLRGVVHSEMSTVAVAAVLLGLLPGLALGRWIVTLLTDALGVAPGATHPPLLVIGLMVAVVLAANTLASVPARRAARGPAIELAVAE